MNLTKFSERGLNPGALIDLAALSDRSRYKMVGPIPVRIATASGAAATAYFIQDASTDHPLGVLGLPGTLAVAHVVTGQLPAGGTLAWQIVADATDKTVLTDTANPEAATVGVGQALTLAATNVALTATQQLYLRCTADDNAVATDAQDVLVTLWVDVTEETTLTE